MSWQITLGAIALGLLPACGESSGSVLERIPENAPPDNRPPGSNLRVDVFIVRDVSTCAVGEPCDQNNDPDSRDPDGECFELEHYDGERVGFRADTVTFVPPGNDHMNQMEMRECFRLGIEDQRIGSIKADFEDLLDRVFDASDGEILLDLIYHDVPSMEAGFTRFEGEQGLFLPAAALDSLVPSASRDTDFVFAVTGEQDLETGTRPHVDHCAGSIREHRQGFAGAGYTWLTTECSGENSLLRHWMLQARSALREVNNVNDYYRDRNYDSCGEHRVDASEWFPSPDDCSSDPDAATCGDNRCEGTDEDYVDHVLTAHWPRGRQFVGNHCSNRRTDPNFEETELDVGGVCDRLP